jgi:ubiquitin carboxyl-terminal hydrolase 10
MLLTLLVRIMFTREFRVIDAARSVEQLKLRLKQTELEQYDDAFSPEYVYEVIRQLPRFRDMRVCFFTSIV